MLGRWMSESGFGWVALRIHDGVEADPVQERWIERFREAAPGLAVGGWGVLRKEPEREAEVADALLAEHGLEFYVANAELEYLYSGAGGPDPERFERSRRFVAAFRERRPDLPAGLASYCRPDRHDLDWRAWSSAGFVFLPQAYVNEFGDDAAPAACVAGAREYFAQSAIHPVIGTYRTDSAVPPPAAYGEMLARAGTTGFAVYLAETTGELEWRAFATVLETTAVAR